MLALPPVQEVNNGMKLTDAIQKDLEASRVHVSFANRETIAIWNRLRGIGEPPIFTGWYWLSGIREGGPFRCESAAMRDAWYRICLRQDPPLINSTRDMRTALLQRRTNVHRLRAVT